jgi:hypothetical protein
MSINISKKYHICSLPIMFSRCVSSMYRTLNQNLSRKKYHLLTNSILINNNKFNISNIIQEILIIFILFGILCKYFIIL